MQEKFDLNRKSVPGDGYRKKLADKLKGMRSDDAKEELSSEKNKEVQNGRNEYEQEKIDQRAQWIIIKYLSEPNLFKMEDSLSIEERQNKIDEILDKKIEELEGKGVAEEYKEDVYGLVRKIVKENDFETNPNLEHFKKEHSDIILQKERKNKFILINLNNNDLDNKLFFNIVVDSGNSLSATEKNVLGAMKYLSNRQPDENSKITYFKDMIFRGHTNNVIIPRPMGQPGKIFDEHYTLRDKFQREHKDYLEEKLESWGYKIEDPALIFGEDRKEEIDNFIKGFIQIIENETDYNVAVEKLKNLPKPTGLKPTYAVLGGGYMDLDEKGKIVPFGNSTRYGYVLNGNTSNGLNLKGKINEKTRCLYETLKNDFGEEGFRLGY